jgi:hypothetical protein
MKKNILIIALILTTAGMGFFALKEHQDTQKKNKPIPILFYDRTALELLECVYMEAGKYSEVTPATIEKVKAKSDILQAYVEKNSKSMSRGILLYIQDSIIELEREAKIDLNFWILPYHPWSEPLFYFDN